LEVIKDIRELPSGVKARVQRVFLCDGDALSIPERRMVELLDLLHNEFPRLERVSAYANAHSLLRLEPSALSDIRRHGLELLYLGLESGDEPTLEEIGKGVTVDEQIRACRRAKDAGFQLSVTAILGLAGRERSIAHARATGRALSAIDPDFIGLLSLMIEPGTRMAERYQDGDFVMPEPLELLREMREMIAATEVTEAVFRANHASNYLPLRGTLPRDKEALLSLLDQLLANPDRVALRPEAFRAL